MVEEAAQFLPKVAARRRQLQPRACCRIRSCTPSSFSNCATAVDTADWDTMRTFDAAVMLPKVGGGREVAELNKREGGILPVMLASQSRR